MPKTLSPAQLIAEFKPGMTVFVPGMSGESLAIHDALRARPEAARGVRFVGVLFPGINRSDYLGLHPEARQRAYFMGPGLRAGFADGRAELVPTDYPGIVRDLSTLEIDLAIAQVSPPDDHGVCSLGLSYDFLPGVWTRAKRRLAHINPRLPRTRGSFSIQLSEVDAVFDAESGIVPFGGGEPDAAMMAHARLVAGIVRDGDTLEFGVGKLQAGILSALSDRRDLKVWSGMASTPVTGLLDSGAIRGKAAIQIGVALGDEAFYERVGRDDSFYFRPVSETHDVRRIAAIDHYCAINSAVEVDLFGQVNADSLNGKLVAGVGGLPAFAVGALLSKGGRSVIALPAATDDGRFSRIVPRLSGSGLTAVGRAGADYVVTEHGVAALAGLSLHQRARKLIEIAAPQFRESLDQSWHEAAQRF